MSSHAGPARRVVSLTRLYVAVWGILATAAVAYLVILALRPNFAASMVTRIAPAEPEPTQVQRTISRALAELQSVRQSVADVWRQIGVLKEIKDKQDEQGQRLAALGSDVAEIKGVMSGQDERSRTLAARVAAVEARQSAMENAAQQVRTSRSHETAEQTITGSVNERPSRAATSESKEPVPPPRRSPPAPEKHTASMTPSFAAKVVSAPPKKAAASGPMGLQLATGPSADELRLAWLRVTSGHEALQGLEPRYTQVPTKSGPVYRLIVGPFGSSDDATRLCADLKSKKVRCSITAFAGEPL